MLIQHLALHLPAFLAAGGPVDNPAPVYPVGSNGIGLLVSYAKYGALVFGQVIRTAWTHDGTGLAQALSGAAPRRPPGRDGGCCA
jgi:hypothetical protein